MAGVKAVSEVNMCRCMRGEVLSYALAGCRLNSALGLNLYLGRGRRTKQQAHQPNSEVRDEREAAGK